MNNTQIIQSNHPPTVFSSRFLTATKDLSEFIVKIKELKKLAMQFQSDIDTTRQRDTGNNIVLGFIGGALLEEIPRNLRKYGRQLGRGHLKSSDQNRELAINHEVNTILEISSNLIKDDFVKQAIPLKTIQIWNTSLANIQTKIKPDTKLKNCISLLDKMDQSVQHIISNGYTIDEPQPNTIIEQLKKKHPRIHEMMSSAEVKVTKGQTEEDYCHALLSCRRALETLVFDLTGQGRFSDGLPLISLHDTKKKIVRNTFDFLSGYGVHPNKVTTKDDMMTGYQLTLGAISVLIQYEDDGKG